jgi:hypothetical protein
MSGILKLMPILMPILRIIKQRIMIKYSHRSVRPTDHKLSLHNACSFAGWGNHILCSAGA